VIATVLVFVGLFTFKDWFSEKIQQTLLIVWGAISFCLFFLQGNLYANQKW
jgi:predicted transporter